MITAKCIQNSSSQKSITPLCRIVRNEHYEGNVFKSADYHTSELNNICSSFTTDKGRTVASALVNSRLYYVNSILCGTALLTHQTYSVYMVTYMKRAEHIHQLGMNTIKTITLQRRTVGNEHYEEYNTATQDSREWTHEEYNTALVYFNELTLFEHQHKEVDIRAPAL